MRDLKDCIYWGVLVTITHDYDGWWFLLHTFFFIMLLIVCLKSE